MKLFKSWINEKDISVVAASLHKVSTDNRLRKLFPANKQSVEHFTEASLKELSQSVRNRWTISTWKELQKELQEQMSCGDSFKDIIIYVKEEMKKNNIAEPVVTGIVCFSVMSMVQCSKKRGARSTTGHQTLEAIQPSAHCLHHAGSLGADSVAEDSGVLL